MKSAVFLALAILFEVFGSTMLKLSNGFTEIFPSIGVVVGFLASFTLLGLALKRIGLSTAYAIWSGLGTGLTATIGILLFDEEISFLKVIALSLIILGVVILNKSKDNTENESEEKIETSQIYE